MKISGFTPWLVEHEPGPRFIGRDGLHGSHDDIPAAPNARKAVVRMETDTGLFGAMEINPGDGVIDLVLQRYHEFIGEIRSSPNACSG